MLVLVDVEVFVGAVVEVLIGNDVLVEVGVRVSLGVLVGGCVTVAVPVGETAVAVRVDVGVALGCPTTKHAENSEVLPCGSVAVEVMECPSVTTTGNVTLKLALQISSVVTTAEPRRVLPSPNPDASHAWLEKNCRV